MGKLSIVIIIATLIFGCATLPPLNTNSGRPEITLCGVSKNEMMEKVVAGASMDGFNIRSTSNFQIVMGKPLTNPLAAGLYGSRYDSTPEFRLVWTFADIGNSCTHIGVALFMVTNPGSAFEKMSDFSTGKDAHDIQKGLEDIKSKFERSNTVNNSNKVYNNELNNLIDNNDKNEYIHENGSIDEMVESKFDYRVIYEKNDVNSNPLETTRSGDRYKAVYVIDNFCKIELNNGYGYILKSNIRKAK